MEASPVICPDCGELIIALPEPDGRTLLIPVHLDQVTPFVDCAASASVMRNGSILRA